MTKNTTPTRKARMMRAWVSARMVRACMSYIMKADIMSNTVNTIAAFVSLAQSVPTGTVTELSKVTKGKSLEALASTHVRTENTPLGVVASLFTVSKGIIECLAYGQKTKLAGFGVAGKRVGGGFTALVHLGVVSEAGEVLLGVDPASKGKVDYTTMSALLLPFVAHLWATRCSIKSDLSEKAKAEKAEKAEKAKPASDLPEAPDMVQTPTPTASPVEALIALLGAGMVSASDVARIRAALPALEVVEEVASILSLGYTPAPKVRKARKPRATA